MIILTMVILIDNRNHENSDDEDHKEDDNKVNKDVVMMTLLMITMMMLTKTVMTTAMIVAITKNENDDNDDNDDDNSKDDYIDWVDKRVNDMTCQYSVNFQGSDKDDTEYQNGQAMRTNTEKYHRNSQCN